MNAVAKTGHQSKALTLEQVLIGGDLGQLSPEQRIEYYNKLCESTGLNPLTQPFAFITLNGKLTLYALRGCTDQLRFIHGVSVEETTESERDGVFIVTCKVRNKDGRTDIARGAVNIANLKGEALANAVMKAETKAKRRATLSICGMSLLDESEMDTMQNALRPAPAATALTPPPAPKPNGNPNIVPNVAERELSEAEQRKLDHSFNPETGEIIEESEIEEDHVDTEIDGVSPAWKKWSDEAIAAFNEAKTGMALTKMLQKNEAVLEQSRESPTAPGVYDRVIAAYRLRAAALSQAPLSPTPEPLPFA